VTRSLATSPFVVVALLAASAPDVGRAQAPAALRAHDYSRFSDGPRRVPRPRGASLERARSLGLGTEEAARRLLRKTPAPRWIRAARGRAPKSLHWPVDGGRYGRGFGFVRATRPDLRHRGIDVVAESQSVVRAVADGIVAYSDNGIRGFGNCVLIVHPNGWVSVYAHNHRNTVQPGWRVTRGERIGFVGQTGIARGPHLHFELRVDGRPVDPTPLFPHIPNKGDRFHDPSARPAPSAAAPEPDPEPASVVADGGDPGARERALARLPHPVGTVALARHVMGSPPDEEILEALDLRSFSNALWPVTGGRVERPYEAGDHRGVDIAAEPAAAVRAAADGVVVFAGEGLTGVDRAIVLLHRNGWVTLYGGDEGTDLRVEVGQRVLRGEWMARLGDGATGTAPHLHFELHEAGGVRDPAPLLVQVPAGTSAP
jgi:murein DD-endopeptidase MepM/ murein hydrolase activator NlpD